MSVRPRALGVVSAVLCFALAATLASSGDKGERARGLQVCLVSGSLEYDSNASLARFQAHLEKNHPVKCSRAFAGKSDSDLPGLEALETCDVAVLYTRRLKLKGEQLDRIKKYCLSGRPLVGIRTASHAVQTWLDLDKEVFGGNYKGHYAAGPSCEVDLTEAGKKHPILKGVHPFKSVGSLYKNPDIAKDTTVLLTGSIKGHTEPVAWTRTYKGGRVFYTSLGHQKDFDDENFVRLLTNAVLWAAGR